MVEHSKTIDSFSYIIYNVVNLERGKSCQQIPVTLRSLKFKSQNSNLEGLEVKRKKLIKKHRDTSGQDGGFSRHSSPFHTTTSKLQLKYRTTITQNHQQVEWNSENYGITETTSVETGRKSADLEQAGPSPMCGR